MYRLRWKPSRSQSVALHGPKVWCTPVEICFSGENDAIVQARMPKYASSPTRYTVGSGSCSSSAAVPAAEPPLKGRQSSRRAMSPAASTQAKTVPTSGAPNSSPPSRVKTFRIMIISGVERHASARLFGWDQPRSEALRSSRTNEKTKVRVQLVLPAGTPSQRPLTPGSLSCHVHHKNLAPQTSYGAYSTPPSKAANAASASTDFRRWWKMRAAATAGQYMKAL
mmetsp:Transcript_38312/g.110681  ORF Transcript_38312/g.110681 Transcript_38312/m.110681 type:complete len:224 (-) Transcript_38312:394-1065(-)